MKYFSIAFIFYLLTCSIVKGGPDLDTVLEEVLKKVRTSETGVSEDVLRDPKAIVDQANTRDILHRSIEMSSDRRVKIAYAILSLNAIIEYIGDGENLDADSPARSDYLKMLETRKFLAESYSSIDSRPESEQAEAFKP